MTDGVAGPPLDQMDDFAGLANGTRPNFGNWTGVNGSDGTNGWVVLSGSTGSSNTGPANGNPDPYVYLESSASNVTYGVGVSAGSSQYLESNTIDASQYSSLSFTFDWNMNVDNNNDASLHVDAWNGTGWDLDITGGPVNTGNNGDVWVTEGPIDLSAYNNTDFKLRIRYVVGSGTIYRNDVAVDNLHIQGTSSGTTLYSGTSCNAVDTTGWTDGSYNLTVTYTDSCGTTNQTATGSGVVNFTSCTPDPAPTFNAVNASGNPINICSAVNAGATNSVTNYEVSGSTPADDNFNDNSLDGKWSQELTGTSGAVTETGGQLVITNTGSDLWDNNNQYSFAYQTVSGDFTATVRVVSLTNTNAWAKAGILIKNDLDTNTGNPALATIEITPGNGASFQWRTSDGDGTMGYASAAGEKAPEWLRITRSGNSITAYYSNDGTNFTQVGTAQTVNFTGNVLLGLMATSHNTGAETTAVFDDFTTNGLTVSSILYTGATCNNINTSGWLDGSYDLTVTYTDSCGSAGQTTTGTGVISWTSCNDPDAATLTTTDPGTVSGTVTIQTAVGVETQPSAMQNMAITISGSSACDVSGAAMTWNGTTSRWEYVWDTSACGTS
ncbi:MAG: DUF1349 domain-containing protein, partial [Alphaproteobacteria bacterium]